MTAEHRAQARARCEAATPGPHQARFVYRIIHAVRQHGLKLGLMMGPDTGKDWADADLWANSQADIKAALDALDAADKSMEQLLESASLLASSTDLLNSWARESYVPEASNESEIKALINRLWDAHAASLSAKDQRIAELEARLLELAAANQRPAPVAEKPAEPARQWRVALDGTQVPVKEIREPFATEDEARRFAAGKKVGRITLAMDRVSNIRVQSRTSATASQPAGEWRDEQ